MAQSSAEKLEQTGPPEKERVASVPQSEQLAGTPEVASVPQSEQLAGTPEPPLPKGKGTELSVQVTRW